MTAPAERRGPQQAARGIRKQAERTADGVHLTEAGGLSVSATLRIVDTQTFEPLKAAA